MLQLFVANVLVVLHGCGKSPPNLATAGGYVVVYKHDHIESSHIRAALATIIRRRLDPDFSRGVDVRLLGENRIQVSIPNIDSSQLERYKTLISSEGIIRFGVLAHEQSPPNAAQGLTRSFEWVPVGLSALSTSEDVVTQASDSGETEVLVVFNDVSAAHMTKCESSGKDESQTIHLLVEFRKDASDRLNDLLRKPTVRSMGYPVMIVDDALYPVKITSTAERAFTVEGLPKGGVESIVALVRWGTLHTGIQDTPVSIDLVQPQY